MPKYISVINWTNQGIRKFKDTVDRANAARDLARKRGDGENRVAARLCPRAPRSVPQPPTGVKQNLPKVPDAGLGGTRGA